MGAYKRVPERSSNVSIVPMSHDRGDGYFTADDVTKLTKPVAARTG